MGGSQKVNVNLSNMPGQAADPQDQSLTSLQTSRQSLLHFLSNLNVHYFQGFEVCEVC